MNTENNKIMVNSNVGIVSNKHIIKNHDTIASVVIQAIGSGTNEETLMLATHPMIRLGQFGACTKLV